jgi:cytochrome d ubiquinol oxidase subunit II
VWTPLADPSVALRRFAWPDIALLAPVPIVTAIMAYLTWRALQGHRGDSAAFLSAIGLLLLSYVGVAISLWSMIVPQHSTIWQAASSEGTQMFLLVGTLFLLPVILMYTGWFYWVFRGKLRKDVGYH